MRKVVNLTSQYCRTMRACIRIPDEPYHGARRIYTMIRAPQGFSVCVIFVCFLTVIHGENVAEKCSKGCRERLATEENFDAVCSSECKLEWCKDGCKKWTLAVSDSCQETCNGSRANSNDANGKTLYCAMGCNLAIYLYITKLKGEIGKPPPPYLVGNSRTNESVIIEWSQEPFYHNITYLVQWKYHSIPGSWEYYKPMKEPMSTSRVVVHGLHPYTKYKFRVAWVILPQYSPLFSEESVIISTLPYGVPSPSPLINTLTALGPTRIAVSWDPPLFPNGPIVSYVLYLREQPSGIPSVKDISGSGNQLYYIFTNLHPNTSYQVSVATINNMGEGPADSRNISTLPIPKTAGNMESTPYLILGSQQKILKQGLKIWNDYKVLYHSTNKSLFVRGVGLHVDQDFIIFSDSSGNIRKISSDGRELKTIVNRRNTLPSSLSVDWLNDFVYVVEESKISRCDFHSGLCKDVIFGFKTRATCVHVDPYNGYLYWIWTSDSEGGLYRIGLDKIATQAVNEKYCDQILKNSTLTTLSLDHKNYRLLVPFPDQNTVISMSLEGSEQQHIRNNLQQPKFQQVKSIAMYNELFYWTTGSAVLCEEYHREEKKYYHNKYTFDADETPFISLSILHSDIQPWPVPVNPVEGVQAIFHEKHANISWRKPRLLGDKGAWQNWLYEITIKEFTSGTSIVIKNITALMFVVDGLQPATVYSIKVRAYSHGGAGPWSTEFKGKTMKQEPEGFSPYILWSAKEGLLKSNIMGNDVQPLIHKIHLKGSTVTGISWYKERVFLTTNNSQLFTYSISPHQSSLQPINVTNAVSLSVDWLAPKLYWSNPAQNLIYRANLDGSQPEQLKLLTMAKYLAVDSVKGRLYWATQNSIECSYLNGFDKQIYFQVGFFSGKTIMGITLNFDTNKVYWMVRCYEGSMLYSASLLTEEKIYNLNTVTFVGKLLEDEIKGPLHYFSNRLFWVQEENQALLSDTEGQNVARMSGLGLYGIQSLAVVHQSLQPYPDEINSKNINVIPEVIPENDILLTGKWDNFTISWPSSKRVNYGQVFYKVKIDDGLEPYVLYTKKPYISSASMRTLPAYSSVRVAIRPFTYWSYSHQTLSNLHTPMSVPSAPRHPRVFVTHHSNPFDDRRFIQIEFRWDPPEKSNGIVQIYTICIQHLTPCIQVPGNQLYFNTTPLNPNDTCFFKLSARTTAGEGPMSEIIQYTKSEENPVPQLLLAGVNSIKLMDVDNREEVHLSNKVSQPVDVAYLGLDNSIYWIEENGSLMMTVIHQNKTSLVYKLPQQSNNIAIDWLGRCIYWSENRHLQSTIWRMFLFPEQSPEPVINSTSVIGAIEVNPFSRTLIYTTLNGTGNWEIMTSDTDGSHHCLFFFQDKEVGNNSENMLSSKQCNCHQYPLIEKSIVLDHTVGGDSQLLWIDSHYGHIWSADMHGCLCNLIINASVSEYIGLPPTLITADRNSIYWYNASLEQLFVASKTAVRKEWVSSLTQEPKKFIMTFNPELKILSKQAVGIQSIKAVGHHLQPFPAPSCLIPKHYDKVVELMEVSSMSITVKLLPVDVIASCKNVSQPPLLYTVYYGRTGDSKMSGCYKNLGQCYKLESYNRCVVLSSLNPFTNYSIRVAVSNHYSRAPLISTSHVVYQTTEGAPTPPVSVTAEAITPTNIQVTWSQPVHLNGPSVWYEVRKQKIVDQHFGPLDLSHRHYSTLDHEYFTILTSVKPATTYKIVVRAYSSTEAFHSDSLPVKVTTLSFPNNLTLVNIKSRSLTVQWISSVDSRVVQHRLKYTEERGNMWHTLKVDETEASATYNYTLEKLFPRTKYNFKLELVYRNKINKTFVWLEMPEVQYETFADRPDIPDPPYVKKIGWETYQVSWNEVPSNGGTFLMYELQYRSVINNLTEETGWQTVYYNSTIHWIIQDLPAGISYYFRVRAMNNLGYGSFSHDSEQFYLPTPEGLVDSGSHHITTVLASTLSVVFLIVIFLLVAVYMVHHCREQEKKILQEASTDFQNRDLQLSTLQEFPHPGSFVHQNNALYALEDVPIDEELASVPQICREQIVLTKFLGSGAFGEVFEGVAYDLEGESSPPTKVAIKTLRKGATNHEKTEFMKEAKLMSNFKHDHILSLLGVCLDNNPNFIILELMEGGDLLSYLRSSRNASVFGLQPLTLDDLLNICADVAKGCVYLEEMHFVHRDIAARNCLVSSHDPALRHVKIGDFGLARDIYKNDYYRKEGEGLLPVRWMAPESLIDGVFTSQSDIWAFGVLLWEVMTLGQQPYPARTNLEVLYYVRGGGRLDRPEKCPRELYELMLLCWGYDQESRPSFTTCLETLLALQLKFQNSVVHNHNYIGIHRNNQKHSPERGNSCDIHNIKECGNLSTCSDPTLTKRLNNDLLVHQTVKRAASLTNQPCSCKKDHIMSSPHGLLIGSLPEQSRYLQLLDDNVSITDQDGYEIPRFQSSYQPILLNYADLARWNSISSHYSEDISSPTTKANSNEDNMKPSSSGSYSPPPAYLQVFPQLQKSDNVYPHCQNEEKNVETNSAQSDGSCPSEFSATPSYLRRKCLKLNKQQKQSCESDNTSEDYDEGLGESVKTTQSESQTVVTTSDQLDCGENDQWSVLSCSTASLHTWSYPKSQSSSGLSILSEIEAERSLKLFNEALKTDSVGELIL